MNAEGWPEDVAARFLAVCGAVVEVRELPPGDALDYEAICGGCTALKQFSYYSPACAWAQQHAERCRALLRPGGAVR